MIPFSPPEPAELFEVADGRLVLWFPEEGIAAARCEGHVAGELARRAYALIDAQRPLPHEGFVDFSRATGFDWEARGRMLKWNIRHFGTRNRLHVLVSSPPMTVAAKVFELALGDHFEVHTDRETFESAYSLTLKRRSRVTGAPPPRGPSDE